VAVVGHVEWVTFAQVPRLPRRGEILHGYAGWDDAAGGGGVAVVQLARLAGEAAFYTTLGDDHNGSSVRERLESFGVRVHAVERRTPQRRALTFLDDDHERTITVLGDRIVPRGDDPLDWAALGRCDGVYLTGGDAAAAQAARAAKVLVATPRAIDALEGSGVTLDALVYSAGDPDETLIAESLEPRPRHLVATRGAEGGSWTGEEGRTGAWQASDPPGDPADAYGAGDSFAAALTFALGRGDELDAALALAARAGATCLTGHGPYERQLTAADLA
jgi:ribokinase